MVHYVLTRDEQRAVTIGYVGDHREYRREMICRTGDAHAVGSRLVERVDCPRCLERLNP